MNYSANYSAHTLYPTAIADYPTGWKQPSILLIDDDPDVSQALARCFSRYDVAVLQAYHGAHGIWLATTKSPDVIITDLRMPQGQGQDVVAYLKTRRDTCHIPVLVLTGLHNADLERQLRKLGVDGYFTKPVRMEDLYAAVGRYVDLREKRENL